ncbi:MAG: NusG domain II-containing protein [Acholeplasmataceae bacterium]
MKLRDYLIIVTLGLVFLITFILIMILRPKPGDLAGIYVAGTKVIEVNFSDNKFEILKQDENYPKIIYEKESDDHYVEIILLGNYEINHEKTEIIIEISYLKKAIRIKEDSTPKQIGVNRGWYDGNGLPVVSLPNLLYIIFETGDYTSEVDGEV